MKIRNGEGGIGLIVIWLMLLLSVPALASESHTLAIANKKKTLGLLDDIIQIKDKGSVIFK